MKRENQKERTDRDITRALLSLMDTKPFEKITVQDILDEATVNRSTFYQHFPDKYAVLERLQDKYVSGLTERIEELSSSGDMGMERIDAVMYRYLSEHRGELEKLLRVRSDNLDLRGRLRRLFCEYLERSGAKLNPMERDILSGMMVDFFLHLLSDPAGEREFSTALTRTWLDMTVCFFRLDAVPDAGERILRLVGEMRRRDTGDRERGELRFMCNISSVS